MKMFNDLVLRFEKPEWTHNPEFCLLDQLLETHPELYDHVKDDIMRGTKPTRFGRGDMPTVEQITRAALFKELRGLTYRELEYAQVDSRVCSRFLKLEGCPTTYSDSTFQQYIGKIKANSLNHLLVSLNQIAIDEGLEDIQKLRTDTTVVESNIAYPTNNKLIWDCIKESHRILEKIKEETEGVQFRDYRKSAKKNYYKINNTKAKERRAELFRKQLTTFTKCINQVDQFIRNPQKKICNLREVELHILLPLMRQVYDISWRKEIEGEKVPNDEKLFSIYERHTDIIVKGGREVRFGHKVALATGKSNLILDCRVADGNPSDKQLFSESIGSVCENYGRSPRDVVADGGMASQANQDWACSKGIINVVFNKMVGRLKDKVSSKNMQTRLQKWRSGVEAVISNYKRKFSMFVCPWKGRPHFDAKVMWSAIAYNIRVMTRLVVEQIRQMTAEAEKEEAAAMAA